MRVTYASRLYGRLSSSTPVGIGSIVAVGAFHALVALLRLEAQRGDGAGFQATDADRLVGFLAIAVAAVLDAHQRRVDLGDQLALAVARAQLDRALRLQRRPVRQVGLGQAFLLEMLQRLRGFRQQLRTPPQQLLAEILELQRVHELFSLRGPIVWRKRWPHHLLRKARTPKIVPEYMNRPLLGQATRKNADR